MESRLIPFSIAGIICFATAFLLGAGFWYFFGTGAKSHDENNRTTIQISNQNVPVEANSNVGNTNQAAKTASSMTNVKEIKKAPAGEIKISGGEIALGGGDTKLPVRRVKVEDFIIGETEVSNAQYNDFIEATKHRAPAQWKGGKFPPGTGDEPVIGVTWTDANDYCEWLSKEIGATVRLPKEAEWERAARGDTNNKYPWGSEWNDEAAQSVEIKGKIRPVGSLEAGRSPFGVYEMVGNVWEWTSDEAVDEFGEPILFEKSKQRIIRGGSVKELRNLLTISARTPFPEGKASELLGFRYVVIRK